MRLPTIIVLSVSFLFLVACGGSETTADNNSIPDENSSSTTEETTDPETGSQGDVRYRLSFSDEWDSISFPTNFPSNRHFSGLIGATHNEQVIFWESGQVATTGIRVMAETGGKGELSEEVESAIAEGKSKQLISGGGLGGSPSTVSVEFVVNDDYPLVTVVSMVAPSPDWFVGVRGLDLRGDNGVFQQSVVLPLVVYDAGTDSGLQFTSSNSPSEGGVITRLSCDVADCDFQDGVHRDALASTSTIGSFLFERIQ